MKDTPDWHLVAEALSSLEFLREIVEPQNQSKEVRDVISHHINEANPSSSELGLANQLKLIKKGFVGI